MRRPLLLVLLPVLAAVLLPASAAQAGRYEVRFCGDRMPADSTYQFEDARAIKGTLVDACGDVNTPIQGLSYLIGENRQRLNSTNGLGVRIPGGFPNLRIRRLNLLIGIGFPTNESSSIFPEVRVPGRTVYRTTNGQFDVQDSVGADVDTRSFEYLVHCSADRGTDCDRGSGQTEMFSLDGVRLGLEDPTAPDAAAIAGELAAGGPKRGTVAVSARGADLDSGVRALTVKVGETAVATRTGTPVGDQWRPYPRTAEAAFEVDTTKLADGRYPLTAVVADAGGETRVAPGGDVVIDNLPPIPTGRPVISGAPDAGQVLSASPGRWKDLDGPVAHQWQRCTAAGDLCESIAGAIGPTYVTTGTDVGSTLRVVVVATDASGTATQTSDPSGQVTGVAAADAPNPPTLLGVRGLTNPLAGRGAIPNGTGASAGAKLDLLLRKGKRGRRRTQIGRFGSRPTVVGTLKVGRTPVAGALVTIAERQAGGIWRAATTVTTSPRGGISATLPAGPNRTLRGYYFPTGTSTTAVTSRSLGAGTRARITFAVTPSVIRNKESVRLVGRVAGVASPRGVLVAAQVRVGRRRWQTFRVTRTDAAGNYRSRYRFLRSRRGERYSFRAVAKRQAGLPYNTGTSRTKLVRIR